VLQAAPTNCLWCRVTTILKIIGRRTCPRGNSVTFVCGRVCIAQAARLRLSNTTLTPKVQARDVYIEGVFSTLHHGRHNTLRPAGENPDCDSAAASPGDSPSRGRCGEEQPQPPVATSGTEDSRARPVACFRQKACDLDVLLTAAGALQKSTARIVGPEMHRRKPRRRPERSSLGFSNWFTDGYSAPTRKFCLELQTEGYLSLNPSKWSNVQLSRRGPRAARRRIETRCGGRFRSSSISGLAGESVISRWTDARNRHGPRQRRARSCSSNRYALLMAESIHAGPTFTTVDIVTPKMIFRRKSSATGSGRCVAAEFEFP